MAGEEGRSLAQRRGRLRVVLVLVLLSGVVRAGVASAQQHALRSVAHGARMPGAGEPLVVVKGLDQPYGVAVDSRGTI